MFRVAMEKQIKRTALWTRWEERREKRRYMERVTEIYNTMCKTESQREFADRLKELKQGLCDRLKGGAEREMGGRSRREETGYAYG